MENQSSGSFGNALGGGSALAAALKKRGMSIPALEQTSPAAPGTSNLPPNITTEVSQIGGMAGQTPESIAATTLGEAPAVPGTPPARSFEAEISLKALKNTLDTENKIARASLGIS